MQCRDRHKSFVFNIRDVCFIMKMKNVKKIDMNKKLYEQIKALLADKLDEKEQKELFHHREFEERMHLQWNMVRQKELDDEVGRKMWKMVRQKCLDCRQQKKHVYIPYWLSVAAVALVLLLGATWMYFSGNKVNGAKDAFVEVVSKEGRLYMLPDSSRVWMHPGSSIRYPENFVQNRKVWLKGNSHFDVYKQDGKHFIVYIDRAFVEVKGTSFLINQEQANISKVTLFSGKVDFTIVGTEHIIEMKPSQELTFNAEKASVKVDEMQGVKWKEGNYEFTNVDLSSWIEIVGRIYNVKISLEHGQATKNLLNGRLRYNESLEEAIEKMFNGTKVKSVNTMNLDGKNKRRGMTFGKTAKTKKAVVALTEDSADIEIFEGL